MTPSLHDLLRVAAARGILTEDQRTTLEALAHELGDESGATSPPAPSAPLAERREVEAPRGLNAIAVAYWIGAALVLFAFGWFLVDRWEALGPWGVLAVSLTYVALFAGTSRFLLGSGFRTAGGVVAILAIAMTPVWVWALQTLFGLWPDPTSSDPLLRYPPWMAWRWVIVCLATIGVALAVMRRMRFGPLGLPLAVATGGLGMSLGVAIVDPDIQFWLSGAYAAFLAALMLAVAYALERRQPPGEDYAAWFYAAMLFFGSTAWLQLWQNLDLGRHLLAGIAVGVLAMSVYLRRRLLLLGGALWAMSYLGWLSFDVFRKVLSFPVVLATFGLLVILGAVWLQRRYPALVERAGRDLAPGERPALPHARLILGGLLVITAVQLPFAMWDARERSREWQARERIMRPVQARRQREAQSRIPERPAPR